MGSPSQKRALRNYRTRLADRGLVRFEVLGLDKDRELIRGLARQLVDDGAEATRIRAMITRTVSGEPPKTGGILAALLRAPLAVSELDLTRPYETGRKVDL